MNRTFAVSIGGAAGQGVATPGDIFAAAHMALKIRRASGNPQTSSFGWARTGSGAVAVSCMN
jgi:Pyruvate/2-oxoacid:ferredoxin oxidoreductase gamma subunit